MKAASNIKGVECRSGVVVHYGPVFGNYPLVYLANYLSRATALFPLAETLISLKYQRRQSALSVDKA